MKFTGRAHCFGDNIDTDAIIAARYLNTTNPDELASHLMEDISPGFVEKIHPGDILVAGKNFGCGSSREHAPVAIKAAGIPVVIAESFARIFYRNSINIGLPIIESADAAQAIREGDLVEVDLASGTISVGGRVFQAPPFPAFMQRIIQSGGLIEYVRREVKADA